jgi:hypothetical protein
VEGEAGTEYARAVNWCLSKRGVDAKNTAWRIELQQNVIEPLRTCYAGLTGETKSRP